MTISNVQAGTGIYSAVNSNAKPAISAGLESTSTVNRDVVGSVVISDEAQQLDRHEQYKMKNAVDLFNDWLDSGREYAGLVLYRENGTEDELLPENQPLFDELSTKVGNAHDPQQRTILKNKIDSLLGWGNQEIFNSESDLDKRFRAAIDSYYLQQSYLTEKNGNSSENLPDEFLKTAQELKANWPTMRGTPRLSEFTGISMKATEVSSFKATGGTLENFKDRAFLEKLLAEARG